MSKNPPQYSWATAQVDPVVGSAFFPKAVDLINNAQTTISICIFTARYYRGQSRNPVNELFDALRRAAYRGVDVRILLNADFQDSESARGNEFIVRYFKNRNFQAAMGGKSTRLHSKLLLVDNQITVIGSHNYSARAFRTNFETSVIIKSREIYSFFITEFERLWTKRILIPGKVAQ
jgi:cardiolipin synthase